MSGGVLKEETEVNIDAQKMSLTPLMLAARNGDLRGVREHLGEAGRRSIYGQTALMLAALNGELECARLLLSEIGLRDNSGWTALIWAAVWGHTDLVPLLEKEIGMQDNFGWTALIWAAYYGKTDCARLLLSEAGKQSIKNSSSFPPGTTALMLAAHENHSEVVELLLPYEQGLKDSEGHTAKWYANNSPERGDFDRVRELLRNEGSNRLPPPTEELPLMISAVAGDVEGVRKYSNHVGYRDPTGTTALMLAAKNGHTNCIPMLEKEIGMQDNDGRTALLISLQEGHVECARLLASEAAVREKNGQLHIERIQRIVWEGGADSPLAETYRAVEDDIKVAVMRQMLEMLTPHHITSLLPPIDRLFEGEDAQELGETIWSVLFGEPGALEELDDILCEIEDEMADTCAVCLSRQKDAVLLPCRHLVICEECADRIDYRCPYCRMKVNEALVLEYPEGLDQ